MGSYCTVTHKTIGISVLFPFFNYFFLFYYLILNLLRIKLCNFFNLFSIRLSLFHDSKCGFDGLTWLIKVFFSIDFFLISSFNVGLI